MECKKYINMQVQKIQNSTSFQSLKINTPNSWDGKLLQEFVHNIEVQKFVKYWHDKGINIVASGQGKLGIAMYEESSEPDRFFIGIYKHSGGVKEFKAVDAISQILQESKEKVENMPLIKKAEEFVAIFNKALNKTEKSSSVWDIKST